MKLVIHLLGQTVVGEEVFWEQARMALYFNQAKKKRIYSYQRPANLEGSCKGVEAPS